MTNSYEKARIEQMIAEMSDTEFDELVKRTRPPALDPRPNGDVKDAIMRHLHGPLTADFKHLEGNL